MLGGGRYLYVLHPSVANRQVRPLVVVALQPGLASRSRVSRAPGGDLRRDCALRRHRSGKRGLLFRTPERQGDDYGSRYGNQEPPKSATASENLPEPEVLAAEIVEDLHAALEAFRSIAREREPSGDGTA